MARKCLILVMVLLMLSMGLTVATGCGGDKTEEAVEETVIEEEEAETSDNPLVGSYEGEYVVERVPDRGYPFELDVTEDLSITGTGAMPTGNTNFSVSGKLSPEGDFTAEGIVEGAGTKVSFSGDFTVEGDTVTVAGTWTAEGGIDGSWSGEKVD